MVSVAVVGAGAAGIAAARALVAAGHDVVVYEARGRPGGRAWSDTVFASHQVELGAEFIHGERVATWDWVREFGARTTGAAHTYDMWFHLNGRLLARDAAAAEFGANPLTALDRLSRRWESEGRPEASLDQVFELWSEISNRPLTAEGRRLIGNYIAELAASDITQLGTGRAAARPGEQPETLINFRLLDGYSSLIQRAANGLRIRLATEVTRLRWDDGGVEVTASGDTARFDHAVVTLPLGVLRRRSVEFEPSLPAEKWDAIERLNAGHISKILLRFDRVLWPPDLTFLWTPNSMQVWWRPGQGQESEAPVLTAFFGGSAAQKLESASEEEAVEVATGQLEQVLGRAVRPHVQAGRYIAWGAEPHTWMGYSSLPLNGAGLRQALAEPVGALRFAGEATSIDHAATIHGAIESGRRAADEILAAGPPVSG